MADAHQPTQTRAWTQRYEHGLPVTDLIPIEDDDTSGTTVQFLPNEALRTRAAVAAAVLGKPTAWPHLSIEVVDERNR